MSAIFILTFLVGFCLLWRALLKSDQSQIDRWSRDYDCQVEKISTLVWHASFPWKRRGERLYRVSTDKGNFIIKISELGHINRVKREL